MTVSKGNRKEVAGISGVHWKLPSRDEYKEADANGMRASLPNMKFRFWSSSVDKDDSNAAWIFNGHFGSTISFYRYNAYSARCVAR